MDSPAAGVTAPGRSRRVLVLPALVAAALALSGCAALGGNATGDRRSSATVAATRGGPGNATSAVPSPVAPTAAPTPPRTPSRAPSRAPGAAKPAGQPDVAKRLLDQINAWRAQAGRRPLTMTAGLVASAHKHNLVMAAGCGMSHQCPQEAGFGVRIGAEGITFSAAAENIGTGGPVGASSSAILANASRLNTSMHDEVPPADGHRRNMLAANLSRIGIDVVRDAHGSIWLTEDFAS